ncbi:MAG: DUF1552 domain-containing protein [Myxococcota bacterium]|nr:DUF1552 domain-containing protein [Myxococcota bacterium]
MKKQMNRRMFLKGAGGATLAIPFLPSLTTKAFAQAPALPEVGRHFFAVMTGHGDIWSDNLYPADALLDQTQPYAGRDVRYGILPSAADQNGKVSWSPVLTASAQTMTPELASKFNVLRGLDIPYRISHSYGGFLGNFAGNFERALPGICGPGFTTPTIDQFMAYSDSFYTPADLAQRMTQRSMCINTQLGCGISNNFAAPKSRVGDVVHQKSLNSNAAVYDYLFQPGSAVQNVSQRIIDSVKDRYNDLKRHPRISRGDTRRLDQHIEAMFEIERKLQTAGQLAALPPRPNFASDLYLKHHSFPHDPNENQLWCDLMTDMIATAFSTGTCRVAVWPQADIFFSTTRINDWHSAVGHSGMGASIAQTYNVAYNQGTFEHILVGLAAKLDAIDAHDGQSLLDHSLLMQGSEAGQVTHHSGCVNYPIITAGRAGGFFNTGMFVDFTNQNRVFQDLAGVVGMKPGLRVESPGLLYNQFLANALLSMGVPATEWEKFTEFSFNGPARSTPTKGYGYFHVDSNRAADYALAKPLMSDPLPVITNG